MYGQIYEIGTRDPFDQSWRVLLYKIDWEGEVTSLLGGDTPIDFDFQNQSDFYADPIKPSQVSFSIVVEETFQLLDLLNSARFEYYIEVFPEEEDSEEGDPFWCGYIDPKQFEQPYDVPPCELKLICVDGLSFLEEIRYAEEDVDSEGTIVYYNGRIRISEILLDIFDKIGFHEFKEFIDIYEVDMDDTVDDSPFDQAKLDVDVFKDMYCLQVIEEILRPFNACLIQINGVFCIYRPRNVAEGTIYGRHFTDPTARTSVSESTLIYIQRVNSHPTSTLRQVPGGAIIGQEALKRVVINHDYGNRESWLDTWEFKAEDYNDELLTFDNWSHDGAHFDTLPMSYFLSTEQEGVALGQTFSSLNQGWYSLCQDISVTPIYSDRDRFVLEIEVGWINNSGSSKAMSPIQIAVQQGAYWLKEIYNDDADEYETVMEWDDTFLPGELRGIDRMPDDFYGSMYVAPGFTGWNTIKKEFVGMPTNGPIRVMLGGQLYEDLYNCYRNVKIYVSSYQAGKIKRPTWGVVHRETQSTYSTKYNEATRYRFELIERTNKQYVKENNVEGGELNLDYVIGDVTDIEIDNVLGQFKGSIEICATASDLDKQKAAITAFYTSHASAYTVTGLILTPNQNMLTFSGYFAFTGSTTIESESSFGNLEGEVENVQAYAAGTKQIATLTLTGTSGEAEIYVGSLTLPIEFSGSLVDTVATFVATNDETCLGIGVVLTQGSYPDDADIICTEQNEEGGFGSVSILNLGGDLHGTLTPAKQTAAVSATPQVDRITLSGNEGEAWITCNGIKREIGIPEDAESSKFSERWGPRNTDFVNGKPLLTLAVEEIAAQHIRNKQLLNVPILERGETMSFNRMGCLIDDLNEVDSSDNERKFVMSRGTLDARNKRWDVDLIEIIED